MWHSLYTPQGFYKYMLLKKNVNKKKGLPNNRWNVIGEYSSGLVKVYPTMQNDYWQAELVCMEIEIYPKK